jgi:hypothetical protein
MAKQEDTEIYRGLVVANMYWMVGEVHIRAFHQTARVILFGFVDEAARRRYDAPIRQHGFEVGYNQYEKYFAPSQLQDAGSDPVAAAYKLITDEPQVAFIADVFGRVNFFTDAKDV